MQSVRQPRQQNEKKRSAHGLNASFSRRHMIGAALDAEYERLSGKSASDIARARLGASDLERFLIDAGVAGAQIAADTAAYTLLPGAGIALKGVRSFGDASQEARKAGASIGQQVTYGSAKAALDIGTRKIAKSVSAYGKGLADNAVTKKALTPVERKAAQKAAKALMNAGSGASEAFLSDILDPMLGDIYNGKGKNSLSVWDDAWHDALINGIISGALSAYEDAQNAYSRRVANSFNSMTDSALQSKLRNAYIGSLKPNMVGDVSFMESLPEYKGGWYVPRK